MAKKNSPARFSPAPAIGLEFPAVRIASLELYAHPLMAQLGDERLDRLRPLIERVVSAARRADESAPAGLGLRSAVALTGGSVITSIEPPRADVDVDIHVMAEIGPDFQSNGVDLASALVGYLQTLARHVADGTSIAFTQVRATGARYSRQAQRYDESRTWTIEEFWRPAATTALHRDSLPRAVGEAAMMGLTFGVKSEERTMMLDLMIVYSIFDRRGRCEFATGGIACWFGHVIYDSHSLQAYNQLFKLRRQIPGTIVGVSRIEDVYRETITSALTRGLYLEVATKLARLYALREDAARMGLILESTFLERAHAAKAISVQLNAACDLSRVGALDVDGMRAAVRDAAKLWAQRSDETTDDARSESAPDFEELIRRTGAAPDAPVPSSPPLDRAGLERAIGTFASQLYDHAMARAKVFLDANPTLLAGIESWVKGDLTAPS